MHSDICFLETGACFTACTMYKMPGGLNVIIIGLETQFLGIKLYIFSYPSVFAYVLGAQKNHLIEMVL